MDAPSALRALAESRAASAFPVPISPEERLSLVDAALTTCPPPRPTVSVVGGCRRLPAEAPRLIGLVGMPRSGKDLIAEFVCSRYAGVRRLAFSDTIIVEANAFLEPFGAKMEEGNKSHPPYRLLLQTFGLVRRRQQESYWVERVAEAIRAAWAEGADLVITTGVRAPSDVQLIRDLGGQLWRVRRPGHETLADLHPVERMLADWSDDEFDRVLLNQVEGDTRAYLASAEAALSQGAGD